MDFGEKYDLWWCDELSFHCLSHGARLLQQPAGGTVRTGCPRAIVASNNIPFRQHVVVIVVALESHENRRVAHQR